MYAMQGARRAPVHHTPGNAPTIGDQGGNIARDSDHSERDLRHDKLSNASHAGLLAEPLGSLAFLVQKSRRRSRREVEFESAATC
ncbi:hypothetical protein F511_37443 [Dorcoceras hygrometricum]|uniref:Uncharacterized protein n=1 Tax=Dorcoceras hygrometricum TaxID=472368 RepID=A0A2Z7CJ12_9LAMI|nr:hypothetical protein F511_37443 [Dorcoceras hygrometricum]